MNAQLDLELKLLCVNSSRFKEAFIIKRTSFEEIDTELYEHEGYEITFNRFTKFKKGELVSDYDAFMQKADFQDECSVVFI